MDVDISLNSTTNQCLCWSGDQSKRGIWKSPLCLGDFLLGAVAIWFTLRIVCICSVVVVLALVLLFYENPIQNNVFLQLNWTILAHIIVLPTHWCSMWWRNTDAILISSTSLINLIAPNSLPEVLLGMLTVERVMFKCDESEVATTGRLQDFNNIIKMQVDSYQNVISPLG